MMTFSFLLPIWQTMPFGSRLAVLLRNAHDTAFAWIDSKTKEQSKPFPLQERAYKYELVALTKNKILFHQYDASVSIPVIIGLCAYNLSGELSWEVPFTQLLEVGASSIQVKFSAYGREENQILSLDTGDISAVFSPVPSTKIELPELYRQDSPHFKSFEMFLKRFEVKPHLGVEYLETERGIVLSFYERLEKGFRNHLWVIDNQQEVLEKVVLARHTKGLGQNTFWQQARKVWMIEERKIVRFFSV
ncbi:MAG: hypothetical protein AAF740_01310 [Bacteroidota bacterium]